MRLNLFQSLKPLFLNRSFYSMMFVQCVTGGTRNSEDTFLIENAVNCQYVKTLRNFFLVTESTMDLQTENFPL